MKPIRPEDISITIPEIIVQAVNELIKELYRGSYFTFTLKELKRKLSNLGVTEREIINFTDTKAFNFEKLYKEYSWNVKYEKPDRDEDFDSYFKFTPIKNNYDKSGDFERI